MVRRWGPPSQGWLTFLHNHAGTVRPSAMILPHDANLYRMEYSERTTHRNMIGEIEVIARVCVYLSITAIALISIRYSGDVILQTSTMVEAGAGALKYSRRTL
jgi:hypothetical protein